jgi:hypothetical protein
MGSVISWLAGARSGSVSPTPPQAGTINACVHRVNHHVRIVSNPAECRRFESPGLADRGPQAMGIPGPAGPQGPQGEQGPPGPAGSLGVSVVDATGQKIGATIRLAGNNATVLVTLDGLMFPLDVTPQGFKFSKDSAGGNLIFAESANCTGPASYAAEPFFSPMKVAVVGPPGATLYITDDTREAIRDSVGGSQWRQQWDGSWMCYSHWGSGSGTLIPVQQPSFDLNTLFPPPFSVR